MCARLARWTMRFAVFGLVGCASLGPGPDIQLAQLAADRVVEGELSDAQTVDGVPCRVVRKGPAAVIAVDGWWGWSPRPGQGRMYQANVRYRDTVDEPARFLAFAGLGRYDGLTELHRFGGLADGQWKTVRVPLPWDMVMLVPHTRQTRLAIQSPGGDLPVASITVGPLDADAPQRYNQQTRQWVARVQAKRPGPVGEIIESQQPQLTPELAAQAIVPYVRSYMSVIYRNSAPQADEAVRPLSVRMATNEYEPAAFAVYAPSEKLTNVVFEVGPLTGPEGALVVEVERRTAEYCLVQHRDRRARRATLAFFPQRLWPAYPVDVPAGESHWFWITLKTDPAKSKPGSYQGEVTIRADQGQATLPLHVEVLPIRLQTMDEAGLLMGGCHPALVPAHEMDVLREHNFNMYNIWWSIAPEMKIENGKMELDFARLDHWMKTAARHGLKAMVWFLGGNPYGYPRTLSIEREIYIALQGDKKPRNELADDFIKTAASEANRGKTLAEVEPYYREWVSRVWKYAKGHGWPELIMTPFDEPAKWVQGPYRKPGESHPDVIGAGPWIKDHFKHACRILHDSAPGVRVYGSIHHNHVPGPDGKPPRSEFPAIYEGEVFLEDVEVFCTNAIHEDPNLGNKVRAVDKDFWQYSGGGSAGEPDRGRFAFGFFFGAFNSRGSLLWAYDWGPGFDTTQGSNWMIAWRTPFDVIPSAYFEAVREAWDDRRYIETLKHVAKSKGADVCDFIEKLSQDAVELRGPGGRDTVYDFYAQPKDLGAIDQMREQVIAKILELTG